MDCEFQCKIFQFFSLILTMLSYNKNLVSFCCNFPLIHYQCLMFMKAFIIWNEMMQIQDFFSDDFWYDSSTPCNGHKIKADEGWKNDFDHLCWIILAVDWGNERNKKWFSTINETRDRKKRKKKRKGKINLGLEERILWREFTLIY